MVKNTAIIALVVIIFVALAVVGSLALMGFFTQKTPSGNMDQFALCLSSKGVTMYGAEWCSHCQNQKRTFGDSFKYVNYVECPQNMELCGGLGVRGYPTWIINGFLYPGERSLQELGDLSGCSLPE